MEKPSIYFYYIHTFIYFIFIIVSFEGFINVITNPTYFDKKYWEWIVANEPNVYLALGCHPSDASTYDEIADWQLEKGKLKA